MKIISIITLNKEKSPDIRVLNKYFTNLRTSLFHFTFTILKFLLFHFYVLLCTITICTISSFLFPNQFSLSSFSGLLSLSFIHTFDQLHLISGLFINHVHHLSLPLKHPLPFSTRISTSLFHHHRIHRFAIVGDLKQKGVVYTS